VIQSNRDALIVFARNPILGKVKTRLAKDVGEDRALEVYINLLNHTYIQTKNLFCDKFLFLSEKTDNNLFDKTFNQLVQNGNGLGEKMKIAFKKLFEMGYQKILIIGTDCPGLTEEIILNAFEYLLGFDFIIGPSIDGGYYLLGMKEPNYFVFENMVWSNEQVLNRTIKKIKSKNKKFHLLKELKDIDEEKDFHTVLF